MGIVKEQKSSRAERNLAGNTTPWPHGLVVMGERKARQRNRQARETKVTTGFATPAARAWG